MVFGRILPPLIHRFLSVLKLALFINERISFSEYQESIKQANADYSKWRNMLEQKEQNPN